MLKYASKLPSNVELGMVGWGQSNSRPWGSKLEGFGKNPQLNNARVGLYFTGLVVTTVALNTPTSFVVATPLTANEWGPGGNVQLRLIGTANNPATVLVGVGVITANDAGHLTVSWAVAPSGTGTFAGYLVRTDMRWSYYENVRVLVPYQPELISSYPVTTPVAPGYTIPASITSYADLGLFVPFSFLEGIEGYGISDVFLGGGAVGATSITFTITNVQAPVNLLAGGYIRVDHGGGTSYSTVVSNTGTVITVTAWQGAGTPTGSPGAWGYEAWLPHFSNSPAHFTPGAGFRYPTNDFMPPGPTKNRARGNAAAGYGDRFGNMIENAWRLANIVGRRINVIILGINSAGQTLRNLQNYFGIQGVWGWYDWQLYLDWTPQNPNGCFARLARMISVMAPAALIAEGNVKKLMILTIGGYQGEADCLDEDSRAIYRRTMPVFYRALRDVIDAAGMNPYTAPAKMPVVHAGVSHIPYELVGDFNYYVAGLGTIALHFTGDGDGLVNKAISEFCAKDGFAATFDTNYPAEVNGAKLVIDPLHFNGIGEVLNGRNMADAMAILIDRALSFSASDPGTLLVCNLALSRIGDVGKIKSLDPTVDASTQAATCAKFLAISRDALLEMRNWSFSSLRTVLVKLATQPNTEWDFAYALPFDLLRAVAVLPPGAADDFGSNFTDTANLAITGGATILPTTGYTPQPYSIENDADGNAILYTDVDAAELRYTARVVDSTRWSQEFTMTLTWYLAVALAGALIKGDAGAGIALQMQKGFQMALADAATADSNSQRQAKPDHVVTWFAARS